jgi:hypothetical protein
MTQGIEYIHEEIHHIHEGRPGAASIAAVNDAVWSGVSWPAVFAGGAVTAAFGLVLLLLGVGFGLSAISPWAGAGASGATLSALAIGWLVVLNAASAALGGYLAGRLRTKWTQVHTDEVYFRDTAHGLLSWALAVVIAAAFLASAATVISRPSDADSFDRMSRAGAQGPVAAAEAYYVDTLFRSARPADAVSDSTRAEAGRLMARILKNPDGSAADKAYLTQLVAARTGLGPADAGRQVEDVLTQARADLDAVRRGAARASLWTFLALLIGAFCASLAATVGGRQRDHLPAI